MVDVLNPKDSHTYSKSVFHLICNSFGVAYRYGHLIGYKYTIPLGLAFQKSNKLIIFHSLND